MPPRVIDRGHIRLKLLRELALGEKNQVQLASEYGVGQSAISMFATRYSDQIEEIRGKLDDEFAGLWIAQKANRLAAYQQDVDDVDSDEDKNTAEWRRIKHNAVKSVAEELGQIPNKSTIQHEGTVIHKYEGVDPDKV